MDGFSSPKSYGTPSARRWDQVLSRLQMADAAFNVLDADDAPVRQQNAVLDLAAQVRTVMWKTPAPDLPALVWKLEQAIIYEGLEEESSHPLQMVLRDLRALGAN